MTNLSFTIIHAWSDFSQIIKAEDNLVQGYYAGKIANNLLSPLVQNVSLNELLWHLRILHKREILN